MEGRGFLLQGCNSSVNILNLLNKQNYITSQKHNFMLENLFLEVLRNL